MKLISKTILYYLLICLPLLIIAGFLSYYLIKLEVQDGTDEALWKEKLQGERAIKLQAEAKKIYLSLDSISTITPISFHKESYSFSDSLIYDRYEEEELNYRFLKSYFTLNKQTYLITVAKTTFEEDDLMESLFSTFAIILASLMLAFFAVNWFLSKTLWKPFYKTLDTLNKYELKNYSNINFSSASTKEFGQLNKALNKMTEKIHNDFLQQKEFTENASHEMQTPLTIIKANISLLMQSPNLQAEEMSYLQTIDNTTKKMTSLNKALLLLAKIDNHQFKEITTFNIAVTLKNVLLHFEDLLIAKHIIVESNLTEEATVHMNAALAEILITNLIQNAIRHNTIGGKIMIDIKNNSLIIANTGQPLTIKPNDLFVRFKKNDASKESLGLGLSILKSITQLYNYSITYNYHHELHIFTLKF